MKENDYFLNMLENPDFSPKDFRNVGLSMANTSLEDKDTYKNLDFIKTNSFFQTNGKFDEAKFDKTYDIVSLSFKVFSDVDLLEKIADDPIYSKYNMFADPEKRRSDEDTSIKKVINPLRNKTGLLSPTSVLDSDFSVRENAQKELTWDGATNSWLEAPNDNFGNNWKYTRVLAQYDEDVYDDLGNLIHQKGEKKLNENGTYYYENLNGRSVYGREVLSKFDTLTVDGSALNKIDFLDSDGRHKHFVGSMMKTAIKLAPLLVPQIAPWYLGTRVALNTAELMAKMGKVFGGSDSPTLSAIEGYMESLSFSLSDYTLGSQERGEKAHMWSIESLLNMAGDAVLQIAEQRWIFKNVPSVFMGKAGYDDAAKEAMRKKAIKDQAKKYEKLYLKNAQSKGAIDHAVFKELTTNLNADEVLEAYMKLYYNIGMYVGRTYMTGIVAADAYGEAKLAGLSDFEAAALTLGYAAAEWALLSSDLGKWILPELLSSKLLYAQIIRKLAHDPNRPKFDANLSPALKTNWVRNWYNKGKNLVQSVHNPAASAFKTAVGGAIAEGTEEVSEELLYDLSKTLFKLGKYYATGEETENLHAFDDVLNRYALSFVGGAFGGGITTLTSDFKQAKQIESLSKLAAYQTLVHIIDLGGKEDFMKVARKMPWDSEELQAYTPVVNGLEQYKSGNKWNNKNVAFLDALLHEVDMIEDILKANGGTFSDDSLMNILTDAGRKFKLGILQQSHFMPAFLEEFNDIQTKIVEKSVELINLYKLMQPDTDASKHNPSAEEKLRIENAKSKASLLKKEIKELVEKKLEFTTGKRNAEYISKAAFQMSDELSGAFLENNFIDFAERKENTSFEKISKQRREELEKEWEERKEHRLKEDYEYAYDKFQLAIILSTPLLTTHYKKYFNEDNPLTIVQNALGAISDIALMDKAVVNETVLQAPAIKLNANSDQNARRLLYVTVAEMMGALPIDTSGMNPEEISMAIDLELKRLLELNNGEAVDMLNDKVIQAEFISAPEKEFLMSALKQISLGNKSFNKLSNLVTRINNKQSSPVNELLDNWVLSTGSELSVTSLVKFLEENLIKQHELNKVGDFTVGDKISKQIEEAIIKSRLLAATILAARTDYVSETNIVGYNALVNDITQKREGKQDLAVIDKQIADLLLEDLNKIVSTLQYFLKLNAINTGEKLKENSKIDTKVSYILYDKLRKLVNAPDFPPKDWEGAEELKQVLNSLPLLADVNFEKTVDLTIDLRVSLKRDKIKFEDAVHEFFKKNKGRDLFELIVPDKYNFNVMDTSVLDLETTDISDSRFIFYLASLAVAGGTDYYNLYINSIPDSLAPLPGLEFATRLALTFLLDKDTFGKFAEAHNKVLKNQPVIDIDGRAFSDSLDSGTSIDFFRTFLIDGIAGAGKTTAVLRSVFAMILNIPSAKHLLDDVWFVGPDVEFATKIASNLGFDVSNSQWVKEHCFSREDMLSKMSPDLKRTITDGQLDISPDLIVEKDSFWHWDCTINKAVKAPSLIVIDEVSGLSLQDLLLVDTFSKEFDIANIAMGDFDLVSLHGKCDLPDYELDSSVWSGNFIGGYKLGTCMRASSRLIDTNSKILRAALKGLKAHESKATLKFSIYDKEGILLGWKNAENEDDDITKQNIENWIKELQSDSSKSSNQVKIGYAHNTTSGNLYDIMLELKDLYGDVIDDNPGGTSQGKELDYYVVDFDFDNAENHVQFWEQVYTGFTRAKKGVIFNVIGDENAEFEQIDSEDILEYSLGETEIAKYLQEYKKIITQALGDSVGLSKLEYQGKDKSEVEPQTPDIEVGMLFIMDDDLYTIDAITSDSITYSTYNDKDDTVDTITESIQDFLAKNITPVIPESMPKVTKLHNQNIYVKVENKKPDELNMTLESFLTHEIGAITENGNIKASPNAGLRFDCLNGLIKIYNKVVYPPISWNDGDVLNNPDKFILALDKIKSKLLHNAFGIHSLKEILVECGILQLDDIVDQVNVEYHLIGTPVKNKVDPKKGRVKSILEKIRKIFAKGEDVKDPNSKYITAVIKDNQNNTVLEIPLLMFTNPNQIIDTLPEEAKTLAVGRDARERLQALINTLKTLNPTQHTWMNQMPSLQTLLDFYGIYANQGSFDVLIPGVSKLNDLFTPTGMKIINKVKGLGSTLEYDGEYVSIQDYLRATNNVVSNVYSSTTNILDNTGKIVILAGKPFVLISDNLSITLDLLLNRYIDYHLNPEGNVDPHIKRVDIVPPTAPLVDYLNSFKALMSGQTDPTIRSQINKNLGTETTTFRLLEMIFRDGRFKDNLAERHTVPHSDSSLLAKNDVEKDKYLLDYETIKQKMFELYDKYKNMSSKDFINFIRGDLDLSNFISKLNHKPKSKTWKGLINWYFNYLVVKIDGPSYKLDNNRVSLLEDIMSKNNWNGIYYHLQFKKDAGEYKGIRMMDYDYNNPTYGSNPILINGKLDSMSYVGNIKPILDAYRNRNQAPAKPKKPKLNTSKEIKKISKLLDKITALDVDILGSEVLNNIKLEYLSYLNTIFKAVELTGEENWSDYYTNNPELACLETFVGFINKKFGSDFNLTQILDSYVLLHEGESVNGNLITTKDGRIFEFDPNSNEIFKEIIQQTFEEEVEESEESEEYEDDIDYESMLEAEEEISENEETISESPKKVTSVLSNTSAVNSSEEDNWEDDYTLDEDIIIEEDEDEENYETDSSCSTVIK